MASRIERKLPVFESDRIYLRSIADDDFELIYRLSINPNVLKFINGGRVLSKEEIKKDLDKRLQSTTDVFGYWMIFEKKSNDFIGWVVLKPLDQTQEIEIGYRLLEEHWGKGFATEAASLIINYGFNTLNMDKISAVVLEKNLGSRKVLEKLGLTYIKKGNYYGAKCMYYMLKKEMYNK